MTLVLWLWNCVQEHEQLVTAAYLEKETARQEAARAKADREARYAWAQLLAALRKRMQLANDYGGGDAQDQNTTTAETGEWCRCVIIFIHRPVQNRFAVSGKMW
jgi:hypothetical protein